MRLGAGILKDLAVLFAPKAYVRVTPLAHSATPLGMGFGLTRFASPTGAFRVVYLGRNLLTGVAFVNRGSAVLRIPNWPLFPRSGLVG